MTELRGCRVLVTGATGFIGGRLVEHLVASEGAQVRALVRTFSHAPRLARFAIEMVPGDLLASETLDRAVAGCDTVFHCAYGSDGEDPRRREVNVRGTELLLEAAKRHGVRRVVHMSTFSVYGDPADGEIDESSPRPHTGTMYADSKIEAERLAFAYCDKGLSVSVIQPTIVYGPFGTTWTVKTLEQLRTGRIIMVNGGEGICNAVYVDDVVSAMRRAAVVDEAHKEAFLISGEAITWRDFFARHASMVPESGMVSMTEEEAAAYAKTFEPRGLAADAFRVLRREVRRREAPLRARLASAPLGGLAVAAGERMSLLSADRGASEASDAAPPIHPLWPGKSRMCAARARARTDKAARLLGYAPQFTFERGMAVTESWARWANLA